MLQLVLLGLSYFVFIGLRAFQQLNVQLEKKMWVVPTSLSMAAVEVYVLTSLVKLGYGLETVLVYGFSAGLGSLTAMKIHKYFRHKNDNKKKEAEGVQTLEERP